jgi:transcriptional regulator GlxA family with amidase domain
MDALTIANLWQQKLVPGSGPLFSSEFVSLDGNPVAVASGLQFIADRGVEDALSAQYIIIPPFLPLPEWDADTITRLSGWLTAHHQAATPIAAICTGTFLLAETGLLHNRVATTHWQFARRLQGRFPTVKLNPDALVTEDDGLTCTGATTAYLNFALQLIERCGGTELARICSRSLLVDPNRTSQAPYNLAPGGRGHRDEDIRRAEHFMGKQYGSIVTVDAVADHVGMSSRHFKRRFKQATGITPLAYLQNVRILAARKRLETTLDPIDEITRQIGYEDASTFRRLFKQRVSLSPREYRDRFSGLRA